MTPEQETEIIERFAEALTGLFGPLKPAQAIVRCVDFIAYLRKEHLPWSDIERLFNQALEGLDRRGLSKGAVSRLYYVAAENAAAGAQQRPSAASAMPSAAAPTSSIQASGPAQPGNVGESSGLRTPSEPGLQPSRSDASAPLRSNSVNDADEGSHLQRLAQRKSDKRRMEQS